MLESRVGCEAFVVTVVPWFAGAWIVLDDDRYSNSSNGRGVKVEWSVVVLPGGYGRD